MKATARDPTCPLDKECLSREGVWGGSRSRTAALNASEPSSRLFGPGLACLQARRPISVRGRGVVRAGAAVHCLILPQEISSGPRCGKSEEGNDDRLTPEEKSDRSIVALTSRLAESRSSRARRGQRAVMRRSRPLQSGGVRRTPFSNVSFRKASRSLFLGSVTNG